MTMSRTEKILIALLLAGSLALPASAATQTIYQSDDGTITVTADVTEKSVTYTDASGEQQTYTYSTIDNSSIEITVTGLVYESRNGGTNEKYYVWEKDTETGSYTLVAAEEGATSGDVTAKYADNESLGIYNDGTGEYEGKDISADFVGDHHEYETGSGRTQDGGAIFNYANSSTASLGTITGNFIGDYESGTKAEFGGAICNYATSNSEASIVAIVGNFIGNSAQASGSSSYTQGGAICNYVNAADGTASIGSITGNFVGNYVLEEGTGSTSSAYGGAIYNRVNYGSGSEATIGDITGNFIGNYAKSAGAAAHGGAIASEAYDSAAKIGNITGDFVGNYVESTACETTGGAIYNRGVYYQDSGSAEIGNIEGNFIGNYVKTSATEGIYVAMGGAIVNMTEGEGYAWSTIGNIKGNFIGNYAEASGNHAAGGAILNYGDAADNSVSTMGNITGDFIGNYAYSTGGAADGGAILNWGGYNGTICVIGDITGNFIGNYAKSESEAEDSCSASSGAINNYALAENSTVIIGNIKGDFIGNYAESAAGYTWAGAIANRAWADGTTATIGTIEGNFIGNYAKATEIYAYGGAIVNLVTTGTTGTAQIESIQNSKFIENYAESEKDVSYGGAIYNQGYIGTTETDDKGNVTVEVAGINNTVFQGNKADRGGALYNGSEKTEGEEFSGTYTCIISSIEGTSFVNNTAAKFGGAIYNYDVGAIYNIDNCYFEVNKATDGNGGAIENAEANSYIGAITNSYFYKNEVVTGDHGGGAIYNEGVIGSFQNNQFVENTSGNFGGAIYNNGGTIGGNGGAIEENYFYNNTSNRGGAFYNTVTRSVVSESGLNYDFLGSNHETFDLALISSAEGSGTIFSITGNTFMNNTANNFGGAIYNYHGGDIGEISDNLFYENAANGGNGGAVENAEFDTSIGTMDNNNFVSNTSAGNGGAIYNQGTIGIDAETGEANVAISNSTFTGNKAVNGGAIYNNYGTDTVYFYDYETSSVEGAEQVAGASTSTDSEGTTTYLYSVEKAGAGQIGNITQSYFKGNQATDGSGGAIYVASGTASNGEVYTTTIGTITNTSFVNNTATDVGGAIYSASDLTIAADGSLSGGDVVFQGNTDGTDDNAIYMAIDQTTGKAGALTFNLTGGGSIAMYDNIKGESGTDENGETVGYDVIISGDGTNNTFYLLNDVNAVNNSGISTYSAGSLGYNNADLSVGGVTLYTTLYTSSDIAHPYNVNSFTLANSFDMHTDVDLNNETMDRFVTYGEDHVYSKDDTANYGTPGGTLNLAGLNLISDTEKDSVAVYFAEPGLMDDVTLSVHTAYTPIYTYNVDYIIYDDGKLYDENGNQTVDYDTALFSKEQGGYLAFDNTGYNPAVMATSMATMGAYSAFGLMFDYNFEHSDYYMKLPEDVRIAQQQEEPKEGDPTKPAYYNQHELTYRGAWMRAFTSNEGIDYGGGWSSRDRYAGAMVGFDTVVHEHDNGWESVFTGYMGAQFIRQDYSGGRIKQHGGFMGITESFYKKNFYTAWTLAAGTTKAHEYTMYGQDKTRIDQYGIAGRVGWNIKLGDEGKFSLLPTFTASFTYINPEDFTNAAGARIDGDGFYAVQLNPNVKLIWNRPDGWQPYLTVGEVWTVGEHSKIYASWADQRHKLGELDLDPYTEYGIGVQKRWAYEKDAYVQVLGHSHGRDGILVNAGIRWNF